MLLGADPFSAHEWFQK